MYALVLREEHPNRNPNPNPKAVYSLVLREEHTVVIGGVECVTLAHGLQEDVVRHAYLGTERVLHDLMRLPGWQVGLIEFYDGCMLRRDGGLLEAFDASRLVCCGGAAPTPPLAAS